MQPRVACGESSHWEFAPMGRFRLGERGRPRARPDPSNRRRAFFIMRKAVAAIRWRNTLSAVPLAIQKPAGQANNPTYRRL